MAFTTEQLSELKKKLQKTLADITEELKGVDEKPVDMGADTDHFEEEEDEAEEFSINVAIAGGLKERRANVQGAIQKMEEGKYGKCETCGMDISLDVLSIDPESRYCKHCKAK